MGPPSIGSQSAAAAAILSGSMRLSKKKSIGAKLRSWRVSIPRARAHNLGTIEAVDAKRWRGRREQNATNAVERHENCRDFKGRALAHNVRDEGVAGSNPATPTNDNNGLAKSRNFAPINRPINQADLDFVRPTRPVENAWPTFAWWSG
jgi:hypothetical protein